MECSTFSYQQISVKYSVGFNLNIEVPMLFSKNTSQIKNVHKCSWDAKKPIVQVLWRVINFYGEESSSLLIYLTSEVQFNSLIHRHWDLSMRILSKGAVCFFLLIFTFLYHEHTVCHIRNMSRPGFWLCFFFFPFWWQLIWRNCFISCFVLA